jgi:hypothetical protein
VNDFFVHGKLHVDNGVPSAKALKTRSCFFHWQCIM